MKALDVDTTDGFKLRFNDGWALVRLSGTEPKMRIVVEARSVERAKEIMTSMKEVAKRCLS
jgi:phosphomannomutase